MTSFILGETVAVDLPDGRHIGRVVGTEDGRLNHWLDNERHLIVRVRGEWIPVPLSRCRALHEVENASDACLVLAEEL